MTIVTDFLDIIHYPEFLIHMLIPADGLSYVWFMYPVLYWFWCPEMGTSSIDWVRLSSLLPEDGDKVQFPKRPSK
jgi:hypothetical protein